MKEEHPITLWWYFRQAFREANRRRPTSFYLALSMPVVLLLGVQLFKQQDDPMLFAFGLSLFFVFFGILTQRAIMDIGEITRQHLLEQRRVYQETIGSREFTEALGENVKRGQYAEGTSSPYEDEPIPALAAAAEAGEAEQA